MKRLLLTTLGGAAIGMASCAFTLADNHEYVDLGLPSGTLWATYNIGATKPEELGNYFTWGETEPKEVYDWRTYKYAKASMTGISDKKKNKYWSTYNNANASGAWNFDSLTKYNFGKYYPGVIDSLTTLLAEDDAATVNWGSEWRMPTIEEQRELIDNCKYSWTEVNGVSGAKFTASNGNSIFLPAAGNRCSSVVSNVGDVGSIWSSSLYEDCEDSALIMLFSESGAYWSHSNRVNGYSVRAVRAKN